MNSAADDGFSGTPQVNFSRLKPASWDSDSLVGDLHTSWSCTLSADIGVTAEEI